MPDTWPALMCTDLDEGFCLLKHKGCIGRLDCEWYDGNDSEIYLFIR